MSPVDALLMTRSVVACIGSGGVGKTTLSAALGLRAALLGRRVLVLTIDPARRLATSLGLSELGNTEKQIDLSGLSAPTPGGELWATTLDLKRAWDGLIDQHAAPDVRDRIRGNRLYQQLSTQLAGSLEYMAAEKLYEYASSGHWDLVVLDTPPTAHALDFLDAPDRLVDMLGNDAIRWVLAPAGRAGMSFMQMGSSLVLRSLSRFTGAELLTDLADFLGALQGLYEGFKQRAASTRALLSSNRAAFILVTGPTTQHVDEAEFLISTLGQARIPLSAAFVNRVTPPVHTPPDQRTAAAIRERLLRLDIGDMGDPPLSERLAQALEGAARQGARDARQWQRLSTFSSRRFPVRTIAREPTDVHDLAGLARVGLVAAQAVEET